MYNGWVCIVLDIISLAKDLWNKTISGRFVLVPAVCLLLPRARSPWSINAETFGYSGSDRLRYSTSVWNRWSDVVYIIDRYIDKDRDRHCVYNYTTMIPLPWLPLISGFWDIIIYISCFTQIACNPSVCATGHYPWQHGQDKTYWRFSMFRAKFNNVGQPRE